MSKNPKLNAIQLRKLEAYERHFDTAIRAGYCSYPGQDAIDKMLAVWLELTGNAYAFRAGCSTCIFNLVRDLGTLYRAQRPEGWRKKKAPVKGDNTPAGTSARTEDESPAEGTGEGKAEE